MQIPQNLPITPLQSKAARYQLGLTQANVIQESDLPGHKLKQFETGRLIPDMRFLEALRDYYQGKGVNLAELKDADGLMPAAAAVAKPSAQLTQVVPTMVFRIDPSLPGDQVEAALAQMDAGDERIAEILRTPAGAGFIADYDERTEALVRELFGVMAGNYLAFRFLQGRNLAGDPPQDQEESIAHILARWISDSRLASVLNDTAASADAEDVEPEEEAEA